jgi:2-polyprenyl-3-methyl-5-hydroxy-6-metoxy-1,4-benzoquinol methylase
MSEPTAVSPQPIFEALQGFQVTAVLGTAIRLGLFDAIAAGNTSAEALAEAVGVDSRGLRVLVDALAVIGFVSAEGDELELTPVSEAFLVRAGGAYLGDLADVFYSDWQWRGHLDLAAAVRNGGVTSEEQNVEAPDHPFWGGTLVHAWTGASFPSAHAMASVLHPWASQRPTVRILDVACGSGIYGSMLAGEHDGSRVTFLDWSGVLKSTRAYAEQFGVADRADYLEGDMFSVPLGGPYDVALASHVFHHFGPQRCVELLRRLRETLEPNGRIAIHDFIVTTTKAQDPAAALFSVIMLVRTTAGGVYSLHDYQVMFDQAGFGPPELHEIPGLPTRMIVATRT